MAEQVTTRWRVISGEHSNWRYWRFALGLMDATGTTFESLSWTVGVVAARRRLKRLLREAGDPVPLAVAGEGLIRVEGTIETLDPVTDDSGQSVAAYITRSSRDEACGCVDRCTAIKRFVDTRAAAGRFLLRDPGGVAIVVGPRLRLLDYRGQPLDIFEAGRLSISDGDSVTVVGRATREAIDEPRARVADGYRGVQLTPVFRGDGESPVHVFCAPSG